MLDYLMYTNEVEKRDVRSLAINAFVKNEDAELAGHLLRAWCVLHDYESDEEIPGFSGVGEADQMARYKFFMAVYNKVLGYDSDEGMEPDWPENCFLPKWFVKQVAIIEAQKARAGMRMMRQMDREYRADEQRLSAEEFRAKHGFLTEHYSEQAAQ